MQSLNDVRQLVNDYRYKGKDLFQRKNRKKHGVLLLKKWLEKYRVKVLNESYTIDLTEKLKRMKSFRSVRYGMTLNNSIPSKLFKTIVEKDLEGSFYIP